ncbi:amino acid adenylation [Colletotrichum graminicola M1.001]|uniref:Amino acid adenylation n=1 Tax=Colletotrichum graminicola (strain M1.001 / M2 / FGSC 10212) TaxID=645133 RepID=E3Q4M6_COLGM|nr:amino acid adenylation [Colletotrichum graminicola M1.001]EFQ26041.1 amino acid adenylation [Colletotrichum graminicola M1.001]
MDPDSVFSSKLLVLPLLEFPASCDTFGTRLLLQCGSINFNNQQTSCLTTKWPLVASFRNQRAKQQGTTHAQLVHIVSGPEAHVSYRRPWVHLNYVGRIDNQAKVHGFRVELEEAEYAISTAADMDPRVQNAVAIIVDNNPQG